MNNKDTFCVVFVSNKKYFNKFIKSCELLRKNGKYNGDICLIIGDDLLNDGLLAHKFMRNNKIIIKYYPDLNLPENLIENMEQAENTELVLKKLFQYHKFYLFDTYFKKWNFIMYLDCGMIIYSNILPIINTKKNNKLLAHSDAYPLYEWKLDREFIKNNKHYDELESKYNLNIDYFQTTMMLYDTSIIEDDTFKKLCDLLFKYPICTANDQSIIALYYTCVKPLFEQIPIQDNRTFYYDFSKRDKTNKYIMIKYDY